MAKINLGGSISLAGFGSLDPAELVIIKKITGVFVKKLSEQANYESLKLELKQHKKGKTFLHEINASAKANGNEFAASHSDYNLYSCLNKVSEKIISEILHRKRSAKESGENMIRKQQKERGNEEEIL